MNEEDGITPKNIAPKKVGMERLAGWHFVTAGPNNEVNNIGSIWMVLPEERKVLVELLVTVPAKNPKNRDRLERFGFVFVPYEHVQKYFMLTGWDDHVHWVSLNISTKILRPPYDIVRCEPIEISEGP
jgi:hypothetical protein